ncbi:adenylate/guanylate cyclase domain-containing protein [Actinoplanes sp. ATCC 53533]|uniref:adenylate/guanylate cyclase domain-containing protein n=1 Tax=Actinoplanes sp. ATCC 53533 TaxID=1288362 RepID=UPI000F78C84A|nr:adenylate/guanylate cyclase domain-containing protein [Actinoplanes sp. ATCC 53533]RSM42620.1 adenylate/guanylate cyclase domain-containing protein [Actinoplanes sp. ATCC 53533]
MTCPVCGTVAVPGARFCHNCGAALPAAATLPAAERRIVTVLFGDLSDFTSWSEDLDPERVGAVTDRVLAALAGAVKTFGGHVDKLTGDGIMAVFGAPVAHEDDAERAVRAALSMQRAVRRVLDDERGGGAPLGLRVGLNTGEVVAGIQASIEYTVIGDTVNTAARLADAAAVGAVYAGSRTSAGTRHVASWRQLRALRLKGKRELVPAYELLGLHDAPGTRSGLGDEAPFVGRETELGRVAGRLAEVIDSGTPRVMVMTAEAGIGKTRFAGEVKRLAAGYDVGAGRFATQTGARVLRARCRAFGERRRFAPLADLVRKSVGLPKDVSATMNRTVVEERLRKLVARLTRDGGAPELDLDRLLALLGYGEAPANPVGPAAVAEYQPTGGTQAETETIPSAVAGLLSALARETPLVVIVDDLHDATAETINALGAVLSRLEGPVVLMLLGRPELVRTAGALTRLADAEIHSLPPLRGADASRLLTSYLNGGKLPQADADRLLATAQGNPFYLAELVTLLMERGALMPAVGANAAGKWQLAAGSLGSQLLSRDLAAVLAARIDALPTEPRSVLRDAAVVGDRVPTGVIEALRERRAPADARPGAVAAVELERAVDELLQRRMLHRVRGGYAFSTPLMREAAYAGLGKADLADRHAYLARWAAPETVTALGYDGASRLSLSESERDAFVATHAECAVELADAVRLRPDATARDVAPLAIAALSRMARRALANIEPAASISYAERAAAIAKDSLPLSDQLVHARALLRLGRAGEALSYGEKIAKSADDEPVCRAEALLVVGRAQEALGDTARAVGAWQQALDVATEAELAPERANAMRRLGMADFLAGKLSQASSRFAAAYQVTLAAGDRHGQAWALQNLAWVTTTRGDFAGTDAVLGRAARLFAELGDPVGRSWLRGTTAFARLLAGRLHESRRLARIFLPFGDRVGEGWAVGTLRAVEAYAAAELGDLAEADGEARRAYRDFEAVSDDWGRGLALVVRGAIARGLDQPEHAEDLLTDALAYADRTGHPLLLGMAGTLRGFVALQRGDVEAAEADARRVMAAVEPHNPLAPAQVGPRVLLAEARLRAGDAATAIGLLAPIASDTGGSLLFSRRHALASYASALLADGHIDAAATWIRRAREVPAEDVRSGVIAAMVLARVNAAAGSLELARAAAEEAVLLAHSSEQLSERAAAEDLRDALAHSIVEPPESVAYASDVPG